MQLPIKPSFRDIPRVWSFFCHMYSSAFINSMTREVALRAHEAVKDLISEFFTWPPSQAGRRKLVDDYVTNVIAAVTGLRPGHHDDRILVEGMYREGYMEAVSATVGSGVRNPQDANLMVVSDTFDFTKFRNSYQEVLPRVFHQKLLESMWNAYYDAWEDMPKAQQALLEHHLLQIGEPDIWVLPHRVETIIEGYVQSVEQSMRFSGGNLGRLFPWPV